MDLRLAIQLTSRCQRLSASHCTVTQLSPIITWIAIDPELLSPLDRPVQYTRICLPQSRNRVCFFRAITLR